MGIFWHPRKPIFLVKKEDMSSKKRTDGKPIDYKLIFSPSIVKHILLAPPSNRSKPEKGNRTIVNSAIDLINVSNFFDNCNFSTQKKQNFVFLEGLV